MSIHGQRNGVEDPEEAQSTAQQNYLVISKPASWVHRTDTNYWHLNNALLNAADWG